MKKLLLPGFIFIVIFLIINQTQSIPQPAHNPLPSITPTTSPSIIHSLSTITYQDQLYHYTYTIIDNLDHLHLYPNFKYQTSSQDLINQHHCQVLVNAGFYTQDNQPLGWLVSQNQELAPAIPSQLFNGFFSINQTINISDTQPNYRPRLGLQSGPLLIQNKQALNLSIKDDQPRRRLIGLQTIDNHLIFIAITGQDSLFTGPLLADTPAIVLAISQQIDQTAQAAINLDGGSASTFYTSNLHLKEFSSIGSFFCLN